MSKRCSCGRVHTEIPKDATVFESGDALAGIYFNCPDCGTTNFIPKEKVEEAA